MFQTVLISYMLLAVARASLSPISLRKLDIDPTFGPDILILPATPEPANGNIEVNLDVPFFRSDRQLREGVVYAVNQTSSGYGRVTNTGLTVQRGTSGVLKYRIRVKAIEAERLANSDSSFVSTLSQSERESYELEKRSFRGGLNVPFLKFIGINLGASSTSVDMERAFDSQTNYNEKASAAQSIVNTVQTQNLEISGTLRATGTSFIPTTVFAFIKIAKVQLVDGSSKTVVTTDGGELVAATNGGEVVPSEEGEITILEF